MTWKVFKDSEEAAEFPFYEQCVIWCYENKLVYDTFADSAGDVSGKFLVDGVEIKEHHNDN